MIPIIVIAGSAGSLAPLTQIVSALPASCTASVFIVIHIGNYPSILPSLLTSAGRLHVEFAQDGTPIVAGCVYVAPPDNHILLERFVIRLNSGPKVHHTRPAADPLFISAAKVHRERVMGVVLSGGGGDGAEGLRLIKEHGGTAIVQRPDDAAQPFMPLAGLAADHPDCLTITEIAMRVRAFCS